MTPLGHGCEEAARPRGGFSLEGDECDGKDFEGGASADNVVWSIVLHSVGWVRKKSPEAPIVFAMSADTEAQTFVRRTEIA